MSPDTQLQVALPDSLKRQFASLEKRLWKVETALAVCSSIVALAVSYVALYVSDRLWDSPAWFRATLFFAGLAASGLAMFHWLNRWHLNRRDLRELAMIVQQKFRRLGDRLLGIVELANEEKRPPNFSPELYCAAIHQVAEEVETFDFAHAVDKRFARNALRGAAIAAGVVLLIVLVAPPAGWNAFLRWARPFSAVPRYTLVRLEGLPNRLIVPHGETFELTAKVSYRSIWHPVRAVARFDKQFPVEVRVRNGKVVFQVPGQVQGGRLKIAIGDEQCELPVEPHYRPGLKLLTASIELPDYLRYPKLEEKIQSASVNVLQGSHVTFCGKMNRPLQSAWVTDGTNQQPVSVTDDEFTTQPLVADGVSQFAFSWRDKLGLSNANPWRLHIQLQHDLPPVPDLPDLSRDVAMLQSDVLNIRTLAKDDFGIRAVGLSWEIVDAIEVPDDAVSETRIEKQSTREKNVEEVFQWSPALFRIPSDTAVELVGFATDYFPQRERVESSLRRIHVLGNEQHAELVRQNLESVLSRVEEVARLEEKVFNKTGELIEDQKTSPKDAAEKIGKTSDEQQQNARMLDQLAREGMAALREGLKNPVFKEQTLQDWGKTLKQMRELAQGKMKEAAGDLQQAQQNAGAPDAKQQNLTQAQSKMESILQQLEELQGKVNKGLDDLQAFTLSERLRRLSGTQSDNGTELKKIVPEVIGLTPQELPARFKRVDTKLARVQEDAQNEAQKLQGEINRFYERTQKTNYGAVSKEMNELRTPEELDRIRQMINDNVAMEATRNLAIWSKRFTDWADKLQPPESESGGGSGQGGGSNSSTDMTKVLIALLRVRENEMTLRKQTQLLDEQKARLKDYPNQARALSSNQQKLTGIVRDIAKENTVPLLADPYRETGKALDDVESLLKVPQTDAITAKAQVKGIDLLTDLINLINEQAKRNPPPSSGRNENNAEEMAFLMQMLAPQPGQGPAMQMNQGGGNTRGGTTDRAATQVTGDTSGKTGEERRVQKASGAAGMTIPAEFRDTLQNYFKGLEQEPN